MRRYTVPFSIIFLFFIMLFFPQEVFHGASEGLLLWFQIVLPTLLPFIMISNILIHTNSISVLSCIFGPVFQRIFHISVDGSFAVLVGFLCGYPMGAKVTSDLVLMGKITKNEGNYLLSFCNNTSPMFIISYVVWQNLSDHTLLLPSLVILVSAPMLCSILFRQIYKKDTLYKGKESCRSACNIHFHFDMIDTCIMNGFETITKVGGYIILFSVLLSLLQAFPVQPALLRNVFLPMLEITNGIPMLSDSTLTPVQKYISILGLTSFGGFCSIAQTNSMLHQSGLSIVPYILEKLVTALVTSLLAFFYITFIH